MRRDMVPPSRTTLNMSDLVTRIEEGFCKLAYAPF